MVKYTIYLEVISMLHYCKKCGRIVEIAESDNDKTCDCCESPVYPCPEKYWLKGRDYLMSQEMKEKLREDLVKPSPEFDQYAFDHRDEINRRHCEESHRAWQIVNGVGNAANKSNPHGVTCPYCKSNNVSKISTASKAASVAFWGIFSQKVKKQWHCNKCGSDF